jgi:branched-subunit amino acid aminotransferase/4-amino-4-deoxychorismate lyase
LLSQEGEVDLNSGPLPTNHAQRLRLSSVRVNSKDPFLYHKTTKRGVYEEARGECDEETDAILINERDEVTETTITNIAVYRERQWITPALSCGLLPGVARAELLARGDIVEGVIHVDDLSQGEVVRCFNALRGVFDVELRR